MSRYNPNCWLVAHGIWTRKGPAPVCEGRLVRAHLISKQRLKQLRAFRAGTVDLWDPRVWVWACGGVTGIAGHHGAFDAGSRPLRVARAALPSGTERLFTVELGVGWVLDREFGGLGERPFDD